MQFATSIGAFLLLMLLTTCMGYTNSSYFKQRVVFQLYGSPYNVDVMASSKIEAVCSQITALSAVNASAPPSLKPFSFGNHNTTTTTITVAIPNVNPTDTILALGRKLSSPNRTSIHSLIGSLSTSIPCGNSMKISSPLDPSVDPSRLLHQCTLKEDLPWQTLAILHDPRAVLQAEEQEWS
jgi:hypothetical protein